MKTSTIVKAAKNIALTTATTVATVIALDKVSDITADYISENSCVHDRGLFGRKIFRTMDGRKMKKREALELRFQFSGKDEAEKVSNLTHELMGGLTTATAIGGATVVIVGSDKLVDAVAEKIGSSKINVIVEEVDDDEEDMEVSDETSEETEETPKAEETQSKE